MGAKFSAVFYGPTSITTMKPLLRRTLVHLFATQHCVKALLNVAPCNNSSCAAKCEKAIALLLR